MFAGIHGCSCETTLERKDLPCKYLAHHELESSDADIDTDDAVILMLILVCYKFVSKCGLLTSWLGKLPCLL